MNGSPFSLRGRKPSYPLQKCETFAVTPDTGAHHIITVLIIEQLSYLSDRIVTEGITTEMAEVPLLNNIFVVSRIKCRSL